MMMKTQPVYHAFTYKFPGHVFRLTTQVTITDAQGRKSSGQALWDTGASVSCISKPVVAALGLKPTGQRRVLTPHGYAQAGTYLVNIALPEDGGDSGFTVFDVEVCDSYIEKQGFSALIGMDIITMGDFAVSHSKTGDTIFSFCLPPRRAIDYSLEVWVERRTGKDCIVNTLE